MKKILITGASSYIGVSFENYLKIRATGIRLIPWI